MLNKLATLISITALLFLMLITAVQPAHADEQTPICRVNYSESLENSAGDELTPCIFTADAHTFEPEGGLSPTAVSISHTGILHASMIFPLLFITIAFFLTGATLFGMSLVPPVASYHERGRGDRYGVT